MWLVNGSLLTVSWKMQYLALRLQQSLAFWLWLSQACLSASGEGGPDRQLACSPLLFVQSFVLLVHQGSPRLAFHRKGFFFFFFFPVSLTILEFGLLSHISSLRLSSGHSNPVLTLRNNDAAHTSMPSPLWLVQT